MSDPAVSEKLKVFISYSRRDASEFADELVAGLELAGFAPFLDRHDISAGEDWEARLGGLIVQSDTVVFVVTPESVKSQRCVWEVERTLGLSKRLLPVIHKPVPDGDIPQQLSRLQFVRFDTGRGLNRPLTELAEALRLDLDWIREHTRLGELAARWHARGKPESLLLRSDDLDAAKAWMARRKAAAPTITEAQRALLLASDEAESARLSKERAQLEDMRLAQVATARHQKRAGRLLWGIAVLMLAVFGYLTWRSYDVARREMSVFTSLAATALNDEQFDRAMRYALQAYPAPGDLRWLTPFSSELEAKLAGAANSNRLHRVLGRATPLSVFSPDGRRVLTGAGNTISIRDAETGRELVVLKGHTPRVESARFSRDGHRVVTASGDDNTARIWNVESGREIAVLEGHSSGILRTAFSDDGTRVVTASWDKSARVWDAQTGKQVSVLNGHGDHVWGATFSPDGRRVLTSSQDLTARIWDAESGAQLVVIAGQNNYNVMPSFSPDGMWVVTFGNYQNNQRVGIFGAETGAEIASLKDSTESLNGVAFSPDGLRVITAPKIGSTTRIWDVKSGEQLVSLRGHTRAVNSAIFSRNGKQVLTASQDNTARIWNAESGEEIVILKGHGGSVTSAVFNSDEDRVLTTANDGTERIWDLRKGKETLLLKSPSGPVQHAAFSGNGRRIAASSGNTALIWDAESGREIAVLKGHTNLVPSVALTRGGERAVTASHDDTARIWDIDSGRETVVLKGHTKGVEGAEFSQDGKRVVTASGDNTARIWDAESGQELVVLKGHLSGVKSAAFSPDGKRVVTGSWDGSARIWDAESGKETAGMACTGQGVVSTAFSPNGKRLVVGSWDGNFCIWDAERGQWDTGVDTGAAVWSVAFSPDGRRAVTASNNTARIWDAESGVEVVALKGHRDRDTVLSVAFSPDGARVVTAADDATVRVWDVTWATLLRGNELRERVCRENLVGAAQEFSDAELKDPILRGIDKNDPVARNPCLRRGPLTLDYWTRLTGNGWRSLRRLAGSN
jgi:WD40 repeat protein